MFGSEILEMAIGLVFVYLMFSLICSGVKEWIHHLLNVRAKTLEEAVRQMLKNDDLVNAVFSHDLVATARQSGIIKKILNLNSRSGSADTDTATVSPPKKRGPTRISSDSFATSVLECVVSAASGKGTEAGSKLFWKVKKGIESIANVEIKKTLLGVFNSAEAKEEELQEKIADATRVVEQWFNGSMEKLSEWYRNKSKQLIFIVALLLVVIFNVDSIHIAKTMAQDPEIRATVLAQAENISNQQEKYTRQPAVKESTDDSEATPVSGKSGEANMVANKVAEGTDTETANKGKSTEEFFEEVEHLKAQLRNSGLPLGWHGLPSGDGWKWWLAWISKIFGLLISLMAISMGAPFWFDILKKLLDLRKGVPGNDSPQENNGQASAATN